MARKKKIDKAKKKKIISILVIAVILLILVGCFAWYQYDKASKESTITHHEFSKEFRFLSDSQDYKISDEHYSLIAYEYDLKDDYNLIVEIYEGKKLVDTEKFNPISYKGLVVFKYSFVEEGIKYYYHSSNSNHLKYYTIPINRDYFSSADGSHQSEINTEPYDNKLVLKGDKKYFLRSDYSCAADAVDNTKCTVIKFYIQKSND